MINFVVNENNFGGCRDLVSQICSDCRAERETGADAGRGELVTRLTRTFPYGREHMVLHDDENTELVPFTREEFADPYVEFHRAQELDSEGYAEVIKPVRLYCAAYVNRSFFIDEVGDVYACMYDMDYPEWAISNVLRWNEGPFNWKRFLEYSELEPLHDSECRRCRVLPICQGGCACVRIAGDDACHDMKDCIEDLVLDYHRALVAEEDKGYK